VRRIDFRSDTLTQPTDAMRHAMAAAEVGDDVFGEDPTIKKLQEEAARIMGMEAAIFVPTGTMANQIAVWVHTGRRGQAVMEENCHIALYEGGGAALLSGATIRTVPGKRGVFTPADIRRFWLPHDPHFAATKLVCIENTHNYSGGYCWTAEQTNAIVAEAHAHGAAVHIDGARIFNAAAALGLEVKDLVAGADSIMFCLSKGLSAPVGSVLCGSQKFIDEARFVRKILGGGMRQAGHLAAAGLLALADRNRLVEDHIRANALAAGLADIPGLTVLPTATNMVMVDISATELSCEQFVHLMQEIGVLCLQRDAGPVVRFVTHRHISDADVSEAVARMTKLLQP